MLRPSRPMIRPFMSSEASSTTLTVVSAVWLAATRCRASATSARARRFASVRASSSSCRTVRASSCRTRSSERSSSCLRASPSVRPPTRSSSRSIASLPALSSSWSCFVWVSRSAMPCSRRVSSSRFASSSVSRWCTRSSIFAICSRLSWISRLDLGAEEHRLLAGLDLRLTPGRLGLTLGVGEERPPLVLGEPQPRRARGSEPDPEGERTYRDSDHCCDDREHGRSLRGGCPAAWAAVAHIRTPPARRPPGKPVVLRPLSRSVCSSGEPGSVPQVGVGVKWKFIDEPVFGMRSVQVKCRMKLSHPNASDARFAMIVSRLASENPRAAR